MKAQGEYPNEEQLGRQKERLRETPRLRFIAEGRLVVALDGEVVLEARTSQINRQVENIIPGYKQTETHRYA